MLRDLSVIINLCAAVVRPLIGQLGLIFSDYLYCRIIRCGFSRLVERVVGYSGTILGSINFCVVTHLISETAYQFWSGPKLGAYGAL